MPVGLERIGLAAADRVDMRVDETGNDRAAAKVEHLGVRSHQLCDVFVAADRHDAAIGNGKRFRSRPGLVHGDDRAVSEHEVGAIVCQGRLRENGKLRRGEAEGRKPADQGTLPNRIGETKLAEVAGGSRCFLRQLRHRMVAEPSSPRLRERAQKRYGRYKAAVGAEFEPQCLKNRTRISARADGDCDGMGSR